MRPIIRNALAFAAAVSCIASCKKDEPTDTTPEILRRRVTPALLPKPSCDDTTDDGRFETWNRSEDSLMMLGSHIVNHPETRSSGYMRDMRLDQRIIGSIDPVLPWSASSDSGWNHQIALMLVDQGTGSIQAWTTEHFNGAAGKSPNRSGHWSRFKYGTLTPGCKRLYYYGFHDGNYSRAVVTIGVPDTIYVHYRGHFDVEVR